MKPWYSASEEIRGIPLTRFVASWYIAGGERSVPKMWDWLSSIEIDGEHLTNEEIDLIVQCATNGKLELEESAQDFI